MHSWSFITDDILQRILWQFTSQKSEHFLTEIRKPDFPIVHSESALFYNTLDYVLTNVTAGYMETVRSWDNNFDYLVQVSKEWIIQLLKNKLQVLAGNIDIDFIVSLSAEKQESRFLKNASISVLPYSHYTSLHSNDILVTFEDINQKPLFITCAHAVRKQLELTLGGSLVVCKMPGTDIFKTVGVIKKSVASKYPQFRFTNFLEWAFYLPDRQGKASCRLRYRQGSFMMPVVDLSAALEQCIKNDLDDYLGHPGDQVLSNITDLTENTSICKHGAIIIMAPTDSIKLEAARLTNNHRGILLREPIPLIDGKTGIIQRGVLLRATSIDGAILADFDGYCYAFGVILDGTVVTPGNPDRGSRLNSTKAYVESKILDSSGHRISAAPPFIGIVRSEDGMADILFGQQMHSKALATSGKSNAQ